MDNEEMKIEKTKDLCKEKTLWKIRGHFIYLSRKGPFSLDGREREEDAKWPTTDIHLRSRFLSSSRKLWHCASIEEEKSEAMTRG